MQNFLKIWVREIIRNIIAAIAIIGIAALALAFTEPSVGPTGGTVYTPVNTSGTAQLKSGDFYSSGTVRGNIVNALSSLCINSSCISSWGSAGDVGLQRRVSGTCVVGSSIRVINSDGTVSCETDDGGGGAGTGTVTSVGAYQGLQTNTSNPFTTSGNIGLNLTGISSCTDSTSNKIYWNGSYLVCGTDQTGGAGGLSGSGSANYVSKWSGSTSLGNSLIYDNGTNVGIGTTVPNGRLTIGGNPSDLVLQNGAIYINTSYTTSQLQLYGRDIRTTNNENLFLNWSNASGNINIGGEGENKILYLAGGNGATGSGSYVDAADYWIRSMGKWASQIGVGAQSPSPNGYVQFGSVWVQWGYAANSADPQSFSFPTAFPSQVHNIQITRVGFGSSGSLSLPVTSYDRYGFTIDRDNNFSGSMNFFWMAIGN